MLPTLVHTQAPDGGKTALMMLADAQKLDGITAVVAAPTINMDVQDWVVLFEGRGSDHTSSNCFFDCFADRHHPHVFVVVCV